LEPDPALLAVLALLGEPGGAALVGQEPRVALAADAALRGQPAVAVVHEVGEHLAVAVLHDRADGDVHDHVGAPVAVALLAGPVAAAGGLAVRVVTERE